MAGTIVVINVDEVEGTAIEGMTMLCVQPIADSDFGLIKRCHETWLTVWKFDPKGTGLVLEECAGSGGILRFRMRGKL
jgi:hypothetical protein